MLVLPTRFLFFVHCLMFWKTQCFGKWMCFCHQVKWMGHLLWSDILLNYFLNFIIQSCEDCYIGMQYLISIAWFLDFVHGLAFETGHIVLGAGSISVVRWEVWEYLLVWVCLKESVSITGLFCLEYCVTDKAEKRSKKSSPTTHLWRCRGWEEVQLLLIHDLGTRWGSVVVTSQPRFTPGKRPPGTHWTGCWVDPRASLDTEFRGKIILPLPGPQSPSRPVHSQTLYWLS
jgi:hypothetical protein